MFARRNLLAAVMTLFCVFITLPANAATLDRAACSAADMAVSGNPAKCDGSELVDSVNQEIAKNYQGNILTVQSVAGTNTITGSTSPAATVLVDGEMRRLKPAVTNTGAVTYNDNGLGAKALKDYDGNALVANSLLSTRTYIISYFGAPIDEWRVMTPWGTITSLNGTASVAANINGTTPAAPSGGYNVKWQSSAGTPDSVSAYVDITGATAQTSPTSASETLVNESGTVKKVALLDMPRAWTQTATLSSDSTVSTTALANVTGMTCTVTANTTYRVKFNGTFQTAATTTGIAIALDTPSGSVFGGVNVQLTNTTNFWIQQVADAATLAASTGVNSANTNYPLWGEWLVRVEGSGGTLQLMQGSEVAASNTILKAGTTGIAGTVMTCERLG